MDNLNPLANLGDVIVDLQLIPLNGGWVLKVIRKSCKIGYVTLQGISTKIENATTISGLKVLTLNTFAELEAYVFTNVPVQINIIDDEDKGQENTSYSWTGSVLKWNAEVVDDFQPSIN